MVSAYPPVGGVQPGGENENHRVVGHDEALGRDVVSDCNCESLGRNSGHHCGMI